MTNNGRKNPSKKLRFEVFKRDGFTCQYCGAQPPEVKLVCDHIHPVALGGATTIDNLISSCESCNQGKSARPLGEKAKRPDANLMLLEVQQEIAELEHYQAQIKKLEAAKRSMVEMMQDQWWVLTEHEEFIPNATFYQLLERFSARIIYDSVAVVAAKFLDGYFDEPSDAAKYLWGTVKRMAARLES